MATWIFQSNPAIFDMDGYLQSLPGAIRWLVTKHAKDIQIGDTVFLWRSGGKGRHSKPSGVVACTEVISPVTKMEDEPESRKFWIGGWKESVPRARVWLRLIRIAKPEEELTRDSLREDECLKGMIILRSATGTNFTVTPKEAERLQKMWSRTGQNWTRDESIGGLWAYIETIGKKLSHTPKSPVGIVSKLTGRSVADVENMVMKFRSADLRSVSNEAIHTEDAVELIWAEFFDQSTQSLNPAAIRSEFDRLWPSNHLKVGADLVDEAVERAILDATVDRFLGRSLEELKGAYRRQLQQQKAASVSACPRTRVCHATIFDRNPLIIAIAKKQANNRCEVPECTHSPFVDAHGIEYTEVHHIKPLSVGGADLIENVVCLCPAHHREAHFGKNAAEFRSLLASVRGS